MLVDTSVLAAFIILSLVGVIAVRRWVPLERLQEHHEVAAACFAVLGGLYGIVLAFVLVSSWERFEAARLEVDREVDALADVYRHSLALPEATASRTRELIVGYAESVIHSEWPAMARGERSPETQRVFDALWATLLRARAGVDNEAEVFGSTLSQMDQASDARRGRLRYTRVGMPGLVWAFLVGSGVITIAFSYFFGLRSLAPQLLMTAALAGIIALTLILIWELQLPFGGHVTLEPTDFIDGLPLMKGTLHGAP